MTLDPVVAVIGFMAMANLAAVGWVAIALLRNLPPPRR